MDDLISRQAVLNEIKNYASMLWEKYHEPFPESTIMELIQALPSVQPETGHWIERRNRATGRYESVCSVCGAEESSIYNLYCGNCGAEMKFT